MIHHAIRFEQLPLAIIVWLISICAQLAPAPGSVTSLLDGGRLVAYWTVSCIGILGGGKGGILVDNLSTNMAAPVIKPGSC